VLGVLGSEAVSVTIRTAGTGAQRLVENRINPIRDDAAGAQFPKPAVGIRVLGRKRCTSSSDRKGRRESNLGQHFCFSIAAFNSHQANMAIFDNGIKVQCRIDLIGSCTFLVKYYKAV
jgi:hypothetical protein